MFRLRVPSLARRPLVRRLVSGMALLLTVATAQAEILNIAGSSTGANNDQLAIAYTASCSKGPLVGPELNWEGTVGGQELKFTKAASTSPSALIELSEIEKICLALGTPVGTPSEPTNVTGLIYVSGTCNGKRVPACSSYPEGAYLSTFAVDCDGPDMITGPTHTSDTGPPKLTSEILLTQTDEGDFGTGGSISYSFGSCEQQSVKLAMETSDGTEDFPDGVMPLALSGTGGLGLFPARAAVLPEEPARLALDFTFVDLSYVRSLTPPTRRLVPEISAGVGYAFVDAQRFDGGGLSRDLFEGLDEDSFTLNAGVRLRINLGRSLYRGGPSSSNRYVYFGLQSRWFEARDREEIRTSVVAGVGFGVHLYRRPQRTTVRYVYAGRSTQEGSEPY